MAYSGLGEFIERLEQDGELVRVSQFVNPRFEIAEIVDRISKSARGGKAIFFEDTGTAFPLLINALGSEKRINLAFGVSNINEIGEEIQHMLKNFTTPKVNVLQKLSLLPALSQIASWMPKRISGKGKCQEVIMNPTDVKKLPVLTCWPYDGGPFITLPMVITKDPETNMRNVGMYRMQIVTSVMTGMHWHRHKTGARHFEKYKQLGRKMPVVVALGGDPTYTYAATAPLPENIDEFILAGFLRKKKVELVRAITQDIDVPADADIIIEGFVDPNEDLMEEGPFGDHTGFYSLQDDYPKFHITCITHRKDAVYPATIVGVPPQEDMYIGRATEKIFLTPIKFSIAPEIVDMTLPSEGVAHNLAIIQIRKEYPGQAIKVANALWGAGQMMFNKIVIVTTEKLDFADYTGFVKEALARFDPATDIYFGHGPLDVLDHASDVWAMGGKMCVDITAASRNNNQKRYWFPTEDLSKVFPDIISINTKLLQQNIPVVFISLKQDSIENHKSLLHQIYHHGPEVAPKISIVYDEHVTLEDISLLVWLCFSNIDPGRDCYVEKHDESSILIVDATSKYHRSTFKREWPNVVVSSDETIRLVDSRWKEYNIGDFKSSPSLKLKSLILNEGATVKKNTSS